MSITGTKQPFAVPRCEASPAPAAETVSRITATIARSPDSLPQLNEGWLDLRRKVGWITPENEPRHYAAAVGAMRGPRPEVTLFTDEVHPRAIIIGRRATRRLDCRFGYLTAPSPRLQCLDIVHGGLLTDGSQAAGVAVKDHLSSMISEGRVDYVTANHLPVTHELFGLLTDRGVFPGAILVDAHERHWRFSLDHRPSEDKLIALPWREAIHSSRMADDVPSYEEYIRHHKTPKSRKNLRRNDRQLVSRFDGNVELRRITGFRGLDAFITEAVRITEAGYQGALGAGFGSPTIQHPILATAACEGRLRCYLLMARGEAIAFKTGVVDDGVYHLHSTAFLPQFADVSPGQVLLVRVLRDLAADGIRALDYGLGDARYKQVHGTYCWEEASIHMFAGTVRAATARTLLTLAAETNRWGRRLAGRTDSIDRLKKLWRRHLARRRASRTDGLS